jgi:hypothetical protein
MNILQKWKILSAEEKWLKAKNLAIITLNKMGN